MKLIIEKSEEKMSESAMFILLGAMMQDKPVNISLTAGRSPKTLYQIMIPYVKDQDKFKDVQYYVFDGAPYFGTKAHEDGPILTEMKELFFNDANIPNERIHIPSMDNWETFDEDIKNAGDIDVMVIGLGWDGHFCSNYPRCTPLDSYTYCLDRKTKNVLNPTYPKNHYSLTS